MPLEGKRKRLDAQLAASLRTVVLDVAPSASQAAFIVADVIASYENPDEKAKEWSKVLCANEEWTTVTGSMQKFNVPIARMRKCYAFFTSKVAFSGAQQRGSAHPQAVTVAFDEGAELCTVDRQVLMDKFSDFEKGHQPFCDDPTIGPPHGVSLRDSVTLTGFHGTESTYGHMVFVHLRLGCAVYPVYLMVVDSSPADIVLGLSFRRKHNAAFPPAYPLSQSMGVTSLCLGVPPGYGLYFPKALRRQYPGEDPAATGFKQILQLSTEWFTWQATGTHLTPAQTAAAVSSPGL